MILSSLNLTIYLRNSSHQSSEITTLFYLFYPSKNTTIYKIEGIDRYQSYSTSEILNDTFSSYTLRTLSNFTELLLLKSVVHNHEEDLTIRFWKSSNFFFDLKFRLIYYQSKIQYPTILSQTIDGYLNFQTNSSAINLGQLLIQNHSKYPFIYFHLTSNQHFFLKQLSNNQTELYLKTFQHSIPIESQIHLTAIALSEPIPKISFSNTTKIFFPPNTKSQSINIHLWPVTQQMLDRTISLIIKLDPNTTYEQFVIHKLPIIRENLSRILDVNINHVHLYTFELQNNQIEFLLAILSSTSEHYIHKKSLYNLLKNTTDIFDKILFNQCNSTSCKNDGYCTSSVHLLTNQYRYFLFQPLSTFSTEISME